MAVKQKHVERPAASSDGELQTIIRALQDLTAQGFQDKAACQNTVIQLGTIHVPKDPSKYKDFISNIPRVQEILIKECIEHNMVRIALKTLYSELSCCEKPPSPLMSIVLQLIKEKEIPNAVEYILYRGYSPQKLKQSLRTLCTWLTKWTWTENLGPLVHYFLQGIEQQQQYHDILFEITEEMITPYFRLLIFQEHRKSVGPIVLYMLAVPAQRNPDIFYNNIVPHLATVLNYLDKENSESSRTYLRDVVNSCAFLIENFSKSSKVYMEVINILKIYLPTTSSTTILSNNPYDPDAMAVEFSSSGKVGLNNLGNTCYMNSVLQALFMTKLFRNNVLLHNEELTPHLAKLQSLFALLQYSKRSSMSPIDFSNLARPPGFLPGHQHDSSEFLGYLLDLLHEQEKALLSTGAPKTDVASHPTIVQSTFGGCTVTVSQCGTCQRKSERVDNFWELQLSIPSNSEEQSVQTLLNYYLQPEKLHGDNQYHCDVCDCLTDGDRLTCIRQPPLLLILTVKHFRYDQVSQQRTKLLQTVQLDDHLQIEQNTYELYAAVVHCGSTVDSGHYYTFARDGEEWFKFNDCSVMRTTQSELCTLKPPETPYILFYKRQDCNDPQTLPTERLSERLQMLINNDISEYEVENKRRRLRSNSVVNHNRPDGPPPPGCGGAGFSSSSTNMYVC